MSKGGQAFTTLNCTRCGREWFAPSTGMQVCNDCRLRARAEQAEAERDRLRARYASCQEALRAIDRICWASADLKEVGKVSRAALDGGDK